MAQFEDEGWEFIDHKYFDLFAEKDHLSDTGSEGYSVAASDSDSDSDYFPTPEHERIAPRTEMISMRKCPANHKRRENMALEDIIREHSLPFLPAKSLARFRSVSSNWNNWIMNPFLAHKQSNCFRSFSGLFYQPIVGSHSFLSLDPSSCGVPSPSLSFLPESVVIRSTSNGLVCCQGDSWASSYYVCNPVTEHWDLLPPPKQYHGCFEQSVVLAFDPTVMNFSADYELICPVPFLDPEVIQFEIYSSSTQSWTMSDAVVCDEEPGVVDLRGEGFYMNGVAYWKTGRSEEVLALDVRNGHYGILPLPSGRHSQTGVLTEMRGELSYVVAYTETDENEEEISYVIDIFGVHDLGLRRRIFLPPEAIESVVDSEFRALPCVNAEVLVILAGKKVICYHVRDDRVVELGNDGDFVNAKYWPYVNSLVHLPQG